MVITEVDLYSVSFHSSSSLVASLLLVAAWVWYITGVGFLKTDTSIRPCLMVCFFPVPFLPFLPPDLFLPLLTSLTSLVTVVSTVVDATRSSLFLVRVVTLETAVLVTVSCLETFSLDTVTSSSAAVFSLFEVVMISSCSVMVLVRDSIASVMEVFSSEVVSFFSSSFFFSEILVLVSEITYLELEIFSKTWEVTTTNSDWVFWSSSLASLRISVASTFFWVAV